MKTYHPHCLATADEWALSLDSKDHVHTDDQLAVAKKKLHELHNWFQKQLQSDSSSLANKNILIKGTHVVFFNFCNSFITSISMRHNVTEMGML